MSTEPAAPSPAPAPAPDSAPGPDAPPARPPDVPVIRPEQCPNCDAILHGPYCAGCGQEANRSARSLGTLVNARADHRGWRTIAALLFHPGLLTVEYLAERRMRWLPPVRIYLFASLVFFALALRPGTRAAFEVEGAGDGPVTPAEVKAKLAAKAAEFEAQGRKEEAAAIRELLAEREAEERAEAEATAAAAAEAPAAAAEEPAAAAEERAEAAKEPKRKVALGPEACEQVEAPTPWLRAALVQVCKGAARDRGRSLWREFIATLPRTMFVFLPVVALVLWALFGRTQRGYVAHLVFVLHLQASVYVILVAERALAWLGGVWPSAEVTTAFAGIALACYAFWYGFRAARVVYGEGRVLTALKLAVLGVCYLVLLAFSLLATVTVAAFQS